MRLVDNGVVVAGNEATQGLYGSSAPGVGSKVISVASARTRTSTSVPDARYVVRFSVLKALANESNQAPWESWTSPVITIDRP